MEDENLKDKAYCVTCHKWGQFEIKTHKCTSHINGIIVDYEGLTACCAVCGEEVRVGAVENYNIRASKKAYCEKANLITAEKVCELLKKYDIEAKPLSVLLGWDEDTITGLCGGAVPSVFCSDTLLGLLGDEGAFYNLLEKNKDRLIPSEYSKIMRRKSVPIEIISDSELDKISRRIIEKDAESYKKLAE